MAPVQRAGTRQRTRWHGRRDKRMSEADIEDGDVTGAARQVQTAGVPAEAARETTASLPSRFLEAVFNSAADPIVVADLSGGIVEANAAARRTLGFPGSGPPGIRWEGPSWVKRTWSRRRFSQDS